MKKIIILTLSIGFGVVSCSDDSEEYVKAASELCNCMNESGYNGNLNADVKMNMGVCLLGATVNLKDERMEDELEKQCPEIKEVFVDFVKGLDE